jgi:hypothetical protein
MQNLDRRLGKLEEEARAAASKYCPPKYVEPLGLLDDIAELGRMAIAGATDVPPHLKHIRVCMDTVRWLIAECDETAST